MGEVLMMPSVVPHNNQSAHNYQNYQASSVHAVKKLGKLHSVNVTEELQETSMREAVKRITQRNTKSIVLTALPSIL